MTSHHPLTLLAPARDVQVARAAIDAGADAIYIGAPQYGARHAAANTIEQIAEVVRYAHLYEAKVLVTLNTLLRDEEYASAVALIHELFHIGVDALIIQDLHLLEYELPPIRLHASTQCDNRTPEQVVRLQQLGFRRAVLARELSIDEIRAIHTAVADYSRETGTEPIELEAFVHGALCVSYSGRCYMSEVLMDRSANRGCCAQMCRMQYDLLDKDRQPIYDAKGQPILQQYVLSLQDMDRSASLKELIDAGVTTFKIEGRLKDADYVTNITAHYRQLLDRLHPSTHQYTYGFTPAPEKTFHRGGTDYFLHRRNTHMANWQTPKSTGEYVGDVLSCRGKRIRIRTAEGITLHNGDGISYEDKGFAINLIEGDTISTQHPLDITPGTRLYRNQDPAFLRALTAVRKRPADITFGETEDGFTLRIDSEEMHIVCDHTPAKDEARALDTIRQQLSKLGDTPFVAREVSIKSAPYFIPASQLNAWRREVAAQLITHYEEAKPQPDTARPKADTARIGEMSTHRTPEGEHLMTCRYCILHEMGHCRKQAPLAVEPAYIRLRNNIVLRLRFDCKRCEMTIDR